MSNTAPKTDLSEKTILVVDDHKPTRLSISSTLLRQFPEIDVTTASNGKEAVEILGIADIDLVITDIMMPEMSGLELLAHMSQNHKHTPVIIISGYGSPEVRRNIQKLGFSQFIDKPLDKAVLLEKVSRVLVSEVDSYIKGISLASILQIVEMEKLTCTLTIRSEGKDGFMYFIKGVLYDAEFGIKTGETAAMEMLVWKSAEVGIEKQCRIEEKKIDQPLHALLLEAHRVMDEENRPSQEDAEPTDVETLDEDTLVEDSTGVDFPDIDIPGEDTTDAEPEEEEIPEENDIEEPAEDQAEPDENKNQKTEEITMNIKKLNETVDGLKDDLGDALLATDVWAIADGQALAGYNSQPKACALFNMLTDQINKSLVGSDFPALGKYYILDLADKKIVVIIPLGDYRWGILVDGAKTQMGLLLNIAVPKVIDAFEAAITG